MPLLFLFFFFYFLALLLGYDSLIICHDVICFAAVMNVTQWKLWLSVLSNRVLGGVRDEQRCSCLSPLIFHRQPCPEPSAPSSGGRRGSHGGGAGACPILVLNPQRRHGEDLVGCPAWVKPQQLLLWQVMLKILWRCFDSVQNSPESALLKEKTPSPLAPAVLFWIEMWFLPFYMLMGVWQKQYLYN